MGTIGSRDAHTYKRTRTHTHTLNIAFQHISKLSSRSRSSRIYYIHTNIIQNTVESDMPRVERFMPRQRPVDATRWAYNLTPQFAKLDIKPLQIAFVDCARPCSKACHRGYNSPEVFQTVSDANVFITKKPPVRVKCFARTLDVVIDIGTVLVCAACRNHTPKPFLCIFAGQKF